MVLGCDAAGVDPEGNEVIVHALLGDPDWAGTETDDPKRTLLSEKYPGTLAGGSRCRAATWSPKPASAQLRRGRLPPDRLPDRLPDAVRQPGLEPGETVLVQGAGGGVATAAIILGAAAGLRVWATSRSEESATSPSRLGADAAFESGARLPGPGRRGDRDRRRGDLAATRCAASATGRPHRRRRLDQRPATRAPTSPPLLQRVSGPRLDDGNPRPSSSASPPSSRPAAPVP